MFADGSLDIDEDNRLNLYGTREEAAEEAECFDPPLQPKPVQIKLSLVTMSTYWTTYVCNTRTKYDGFYELECSIEYRFTSGDSGVRYYPDGSTPPEVELIAVEVDAIYPSFAQHTLSKPWLKSRGWDAWANEIAWQILDNLLHDDDTDFYLKLVDEAEDDSLDC